MNPEVIKISINQDERIVQLLNRMLELKRENNQDVEGILTSGQVVTTKDCNNLEEALVTNNTVIFQELEKERNEMLNNPMMDLISQAFKNRGMKSNQIDGINPNIDANIIMKEQEFKKKIQELDSLDYSQAIEVYGWLTDIMEYVNDPKLSLYLDNDENFVTKIVSKLEENNYTNEFNTVNTMNDYYKKLISYQLDELAKYHFFAYEKMMEHTESKKKEEAFEANIEQQLRTAADEESLNELDKETSIEQKIETVPINNVEQLLANRKTLERRLIALQHYKNGELSKVDGKLQKSQSFASRKAEIEKKINKLKEQQNQSNSNNSEQKITLEDFANIQAAEFSSKVGYSEDADEINATTTFYKWVEKPQDKEILENLVKYTNELPEESRLKEFLSDTIKRVEENNFTQANETVNPKVKESDLKEALEAVEKLNSFIVDDKVKNNTAMPFYYKAVETRDRLDILNAIIAVNQLDDSHMYKAKLAKVLDELEKDYFANMPQVEQSATANQKSLEEVKANVERLNSFIVNDKIKNNIAMPLYNKAMETKEKSDIFSAMVEVQNLGDSHMYKGALKEALEVLYDNSYPNDNADVDRLIEAQSSIERYNRDLKDERIKNNTAMPFYNKALETNNYDDILKALEMTEQLDDTHMYKKPLENALIAMIDTYYPKTKEDNSKYNSEIANLQQQYDEIIKEEQERESYVNQVEKETQEQLEKLNKEIDEQQEQTENNQSVEEESNVNDDPELTVPIPTQTAPTHIAPLGKPLEKDYYDRLENAAKEGPIFHDNDINYDITPQEKKTFDIQSIKKAPAALRSKIKKLGNKISDVLNYMKEHKLAQVAITASGIILATTMFAGPTSNTNALSPEEETEIEQTIEDNQETEKIETVDTTVNTDEVVEEKTADQQFEENLQETLNDILGANTKVYTSADRAANDMGAKTPIISSWQNATANTFYDNNADVIDREQAEKIIAEGGEVVARFDNNGTHIGYAKVSQELPENTSEKSM